MTDNKKNAGTASASAWGRIFLPFALGYYLSYLLRTVNAVISPSLSADLSLTAADLGLLTSAYFLTFGLAQVPLGIALDRYGPRLVEGGLLLLTAVGAVAFALGDSLAQLSLARGLIGLGVSACLMAGLKGFAMWYPPERQSSMAGFIMAAGALGALTASAPVEAMLPWLGWRGVFWLIAALAAAIALLVFWQMPHERPAVEPARVSDTLRSVVDIFCAAPFLRYAPSAMFCSGGFMALQSLWAVPWLMYVAGLGLAESARYLVWLNLGMLCGQLGIGLFATRLAHRGIRSLHLLCGGYVGLLLVEMLIWGQLPGQGAFWFLLGACSAVNAQGYLAAASHFPAAVFSRVSTSINLMSFAGAFAVQWGLGWILDVLQGQDWALPAALKAALLLLMVFQALSLLPLVRSVLKSNATR